MLMMKKDLKKKVVFFFLIVYLIFDLAAVGKIYAGELPQTQVNRNNRVAISTSDYVEGNALEISVYPDTTSFLNNIYPIDGDGYVFLPILGKVKITTMKNKELRDYLIENYTEYLKFPNIQVRPLVRVSVLGGVHKPGLYYVDSSNSIWHAVYLAGGTIDENGLKKMKWKRNNKTVQDNLIPLLESGQSLEQLGFRSGDQLWIPTPDKPTLLDKASRYTSLISMGISIYMIYYFTQTGRRIYY